MPILNIPADTYHRDQIPGVEGPCLSASIAKVLLAQSPRHAWAAHPKLGNAPREDTERFELGTAAHSLILEGRTDRYAIIDACDWRQKTSKDARDMARKIGRTPLLTHQFEEVKQMAVAVRTQLAEFSGDPEPFTNGVAEQTLVWNDDGIWCKARLDWLGDDMRTIDDLKTTARSAKPEQWARSILGAGYDVQCAFYLRGLRRQNRGAAAEFRWVVVENTFPFATSVIALDEDALRYAAVKVQTAIDTWRECLAASFWPAYPRTTVYVQPAPWLQPEVEIPW